MCLCQCVHECAHVCVYLCVCMHMCVYVYVCCVHMRAHVCVFKKWLGLMLLCHCRCKNLFLLSTYTSRLGNELELPTFLEIDHEITEDKNYSLYKLSLHTP